MSNFVLVAAPPRTGSSLMCDILDILGVDFGRCDTHEDPRHGRWENELYVNLDMSSLPVDPSRFVGQMLWDGITGLKLGGSIAGWVKPLMDHTDLKILVMRRELVDAVLSYLEYDEVDTRLHSPRGVRTEKWFSSRVAIEKEVLLPGHPYFPVDFERLVNSEQDLLQDIADFCGLDMNMDQLGIILDTIKPDLAEHWGSLYADR